MPTLRGSRSSKSGVTPAQVAELVDALASGASGGNSVEVRVLFWAPIVNEGRLSRRLSSFPGLIGVRNARHDQACAGPFSSIMLP